MATSEEITGQIRRYLAEHRYPEAVRLCRRALLSKPDSVQIRLLLGVALLALRRYEEVRAEMTQVLRQSPREAIAYRLLGEAYIHIGQPERAKEPLKQALSLAPEDHVAQRLLADANSQDDEGLSQNTLDRWLDPDALVTAEHDPNAHGTDLTAVDSAPAGAGASYAWPDEVEETLQRAESYQPQDARRGAGAGMDIRPSSVPPPLPANVGRASSGPPPLRPSIPPRGSAPPAPGSPGHNVYAGRTVMGIGAPRIPTGIHATGDVVRTSSPGRITRPGAPPVGLLAARHGASSAPPAVAGNHQPFDELDENHPTRSYDRNPFSDFPDIQVEEAVWSGPPPKDSWDPPSGGPNSVPAEPTDSVNPLWSMGRSARDRGAHSNRPVEHQSISSVTPRLKPLPWRDALDATLAPQNRTKLLIVGGVAAAIVLVVGLVLVLRASGPSADEIAESSERALGDGRRSQVVEAWKLLTSDDVEPPTILAHADMAGVAFYEHGFGTDADLAKVIDGAGPDALTSSIRVAKAYLLLARGEAGNAKTALGNVSKGSAEEEMAASRVAEEGGDERGALEHARNAVSLHPKDARYVARLAWTLTDSGDVDGALKALDGVGDGASFPAVRIARAHALEASHRDSRRMLEEATAVVDKLAPEASKLEAAWAQALLANAAVGRGDREVAIGHIHSAQALGPAPVMSLWTSLVGTALAAGAAGEANSLASSLPHAVLVTPRGAVLRAQVALAADHLDEAATALASSPDSAEVWLLRGEVMKRRNDVDGANAAFRRAMADPATRGRAAVTLATYDLARGEPQAAIDLVGTLSGADRTPELVATAVSAYLALNRRSDAQKMLDEALARSPTSSSLRVARAELKLANGDGAHALEEAKAIVASQPMDLDALRLLGRAAVAAGAWDEAEKAFAHVHSRDPGDLAARVGLARGSLRRLDVENAKKLLAGLDKSSDPGALRAQGELLVLTGGGERAARILEPLTRSSSEVALWVLLGQAWIEAESYKNAQKAFNRVLELDAKNPEAYLGLANVAIRSASLTPVDRYIATAEREGKARGLGPFFDARVLTARGRLAYEYGSLVAAQNYANQAIERAPQAGEAHHLLADVAIDRGGRPMANLESALTAIMTPPEAIGQLAIRLKGDRMCELAQLYLSSAPNGFDAPHVRTVASRCK